jgi:hypothetical protein
MGSTQAILPLPSNKNAGGQIDLPAKRSLFEEGMLKHARRQANGLPTKTEKRGIERCSLVH